MNLFSEIIDQVAVTIDDQVITTSQIIQEIRVTAFLNGEKPDFSAANRRKTADRLIELALVRHEMELTRYRQPGLADVQGTLKQVESRFKDAEAFRRALAAEKITQAQLETSLLEQAALLRFIDLRFRPEVQVQESDVERYCENVYLPELRKRGVTPEPTFESVRQQCTEEFTTSLVDRRVDTWLKDSRERSRIVYMEEAFQ
ncbi:MAG: hypothetical protein ACM336_03650 [Acidobacteriota bacterium]